MTPNTETIIHTNVQKTITIENENKITMNLTLKMAKPLKDRQLFYFYFPSYWNSNNTIAQFLVSKFDSYFHVCIPIGGINY